MVKSGSHNKQKNWFLKSTSDAVICHIFRNKDVYFTLVPILKLKNNSF